MNGKIFYTAILLACIMASCQSASPEAEVDAPEPVVPVTVALVSSGPMEEFVDLNASSVFLQKWILNANVTGYLQTGKVQMNMPVRTGQILFTIKTKEAASIGNTINTLDPSFHFSGINIIRSTGTGFISELNRHTGDYVQDGEQLAVITDTRSFAFVLDLPYEMRSYITKTINLQVLLPDGEQLKAIINGYLPSMDSASQTQRILLKVQTSHPIPENLIAKVRLIKRSNSTAYYLPKAAFLTDETQSNFWVMKMINDSTAVKVFVKKGMETAENIEVVSPLFSAQEKILLTGNFGLPDTARVKVISSTTNP